MSLRILICVCIAAISGWLGYPAQLATDAVSGVTTASISPNSEVISTAAPLVTSRRLPLPTQHLPGPPRPS